MAQLRQDYERFTALGVEILVVGPDSPSAFRKYWADEHLPFTGLPDPFTATRYHSLVIERETLPDCLEITAWTDDGEIMGVRHKTLAVHGVQFHPESILTEHGHAMLKNFLEGKR